MDEDTSGMTWVDNVPEPGSEYQQNQVESATEQDLHIQRLISKGYVLGEPKATKTLTIDELKERKIAGLYRPPNLFDDFTAKVKTSFNIP